MPDVPGLSFEDAFTNWVYRTKKHTAENLCLYIMSKNLECICITEQHYNEISENDE
jgi:hypothetical protein